MFSVRKSAASLVLFVAAFHQAGTASFGRVPLGSWRFRASFGNRFLPKRNFARVPMAAGDSPRMAMDQEWKKVIEDAWRADPHILAAKDDGLTVHEKLLEYADGETRLYGRVFVPHRPNQGPPTALPGVLVVHTASGPRDWFLHWKCEALASQGFIAMIVDMYGDCDGSGWDREWNVARRQELDAEPGTRQRRMVSALEALRSLESVDDNRIGAIGYCFGGLCVFDLLGAGHSAVKAGVSFHGVLRPTHVPGARGAPCGVLVCHGDDDPFLSQTELDQVIAALRGSNVQWQLARYGGARHGFTNPGQALNVAEAFGYDDVAAEESWLACLRILRRFL